MLIVALLAVILQLPPLPPVPCFPTPVTPCEEPNPEPPCIPIPIPVAPCPLPEPPDPPVGDDPPVFPGPLVLVKRTNRYATVRWRGAIDDKRVVRYILIRDRRYIGWRSRTARRQTFSLRCGRHIYRIMAVDAYLQRDVIQRTITRKCDTFS